jgi:hypothetical protein
VNPRTPAWTLICSPACVLQCYIVIPWVLAQDNVDYTRGKVRYLGRFLILIILPFWYRAKCFVSLKM